MLDKRAVVLLEKLVMPQFVGCWLLHRGQVAGSLVLRVDGLLVTGASGVPLEQRVVVGVVDAIPSCQQQLVDGLDPWTYVSG